MGSVVDELKRRSWAMISIYGSSIIICTIGFLLTKQFTVMIIIISRIIAREIEMIVEVCAQVVFLLQTLHLVKKCDYHYQNQEDQSTNLNTVIHFCCLGQFCAYPRMG